MRERNTYFGSSNFDIRNEIKIEFIPLETAMDNNKIAMNKILYKITSQCKNIINFWP